MVNEDTVAGDIAGTENRLGKKPKKTKVLAPSTKIKKYTKLGESDSDTIVSFKETFSLNDDANYLEGVVKKLKNYIDINNVVSNKGDVKELIKIPVYFNQIKEHLKDVKNAVEQIETSMDELLEIINTKTVNESKEENIYKKFI